MTARFDPVALKRCYEKLAMLHCDAISTEKAYRDSLLNIPEDFVDSAKNLLHYKALRKHDIRELQIELGYLGLSSLGRLEAHVLAGLESVMAAIRKMSDETFEQLQYDNTSVNFTKGDALLAHHTALLLGPRPENHMPRIMVTLPSQAATDYRLVEDMLLAGMNIARINSAHDDPTQWKRMVENVRMASKIHQLPCKVLFDLGGPKLRTGHMKEVSVSVKAKPVKNTAGEVLKPAVLRLIPASLVQDGHVYHKTDVGVEPAFFAALQTGDQIRCEDARGKKRVLLAQVVRTEEVLATCAKTVVVKRGIQLRLVRRGQQLETGSVEILPGMQSFIRIQKGDLLRLTGPDTPWSEMKVPETREGAFTASIPCTLEEVFTDIDPGHRIFFDDGMIAGIIEAKDANSLSVRITRTDPDGSKLRSDKGINLPDTHAHIPALSQEDLKNMDFAVEYTDMVGLSFVKDPSDIDLLQNELAKRTSKIPGIVLKIETAAGFENLFSLLLTGLAYPPLGVMVARGDLGVELGFERMAEVQEQILWLCEAAHVPVIWATQVLEQMAKTGMPTRGEVTDAAMSARAECVMLNKGPFVVETVKLLDDILTRMQDHNHKKTPMLRKLKISEGRWIKPGT
jgi:pyruvate kinase